MQDLSSPLLATVDSDDPDAQLPPPWNHILRRTIVLPDLKVLFFPVPKSGCTTILWILADLAGLSPERFADSALPEVSPAMTVHDMNRWEGMRLGDLSPEERAHLLDADDWFRFTVVRDPESRLWSAWQSKLLLREPNFVTRFGEADWFPRIPAHAQDIIDDFRRFAAALSDDSVTDVHWTQQQNLVGRLPFTHIGRTETLQDTIDLLMEHLPPERRTVAPGRENRAPLRMPPGLYDAEAAAIVNERYAEDFEVFGYPRVAPAEDPAANDAWLASTEASLPVLRDVIDRDARLGQLSQLAEDRAKAQRETNAELRRSQAEAARLARKLAGRQKAATIPGSFMENIEGYDDFDVQWHWGERLEHGFTAVIRAKNEATALPFVLPPLLQAVRRVVLIDNDSTDGTSDVARETAARLGAADRLEVHNYPFSVSRCGPEHLATPPRSVHNLAYFYNWCFSHVRTTYALKWDADMVLTETGVLAFRDVAWQLEAAQFILAMPRYPLYIASPQTAFLDIGRINQEPWAWPNRPGFTLIKALEWELPNWPQGVTTWGLPDWSCVELKQLDEDEFAHWSAADFAGTIRTRRKQREWDVYHALVEGADPPLGVVRVDSPAGEHVVDYVCKQWMPAHKSELSAEMKRVRPILQAAGYAPGAQIAVQTGVTP